jgi:Arc/MetJ-type ribon-helix-helix transcriptional regulator
MVKKKELKQRAIYVYPSAEMSERWKNLAQEAGTSISKFVMEHVENSLRSGEADYKSRVDLIQENRRLLETIRDKDKRIDHLDMLVDKLEKDLRIQRERLFTDPNFSGVRSYDKKLIAILKEDGSHSNDEIMTRLGIKPRDVDSVKAVSTQLENLVNYGLVKPSSVGYTWVR